MRNFLRIAEGVDVVPLLHALHVNPDLWDQNRLRTEYPGTPHAQCSDVWCFFNVIDPENVLETVDAIQTHPYPAWTRLPPLRPLIFDLMRRVEGVQLGRVLITRLPPGKQITPHRDEGAPVEFYTRYQVALQSLPGCLFKAGDETVQMRPGDVWRFDNKQEHAVINNSADDRIALLADIRVA